MSVVLPEELLFAVRTARGAGELAMRWFQSDALVAEGKADGSPVTEADRAAERFVRSEVERRFPGDGVIGEEFGETRSRNGRTWVVDPIDGTRSFVQGVPLFGSMLALLVEGEPVLGVVAMPALDEVVAAGVGHGCWWWRPGATEPVRARVSTHGELAGSVVLTTSLEYFRAQRHRDAWAELDRRGVVTRGWSDCYAFVLLATGRADGVVEPDLKLWDVAPLPPIVIEAGGAWCDMGGGADLHAGSMIASNGALQAALVDAITGRGVNARR